jgi:hypothetical protein
MKEIKIRLYTPRELWMKYLDRLEHKAAQMSDENLKAVKDFKNQISNHIDREPIPKENKDYLREMLEKEYYRVRLHPVWPRIKK